MRFARCLRVRTQRAPSLRVRLDRALETLGDRSPAAVAHRRAALTGLASRPPRTAATIRRAHALLCFVRAYPDDAASHRAAVRALERFASFVDDPARERLVSTGIAGTEMAVTFPFDAATALVRAFPGEVDLDWLAIDDAATLDPLLMPIAATAEQQTFDDQTVDTRDWIRLARGAGDESDLAWLLRELAALPGPESLRAQLFNDVMPPIVWDLVRSRGSITHTTLGRLGPPRIARRTAPPSLGDISSVVCAPLSGIAPVARRTATRLVDFAVATLSARAREVFAFNRPNLDEVYLVGCGRGIQVLVVGLNPGDRLSLEANYAYVACKNGVPVAYGGISPLFGQANTGLNVFEPYRHAGEAALLFAQVLRVGRALFGTTRFIVGPYQIGAGNREAIDSGAFWFYHKLGFRPLVPALATLASREVAARRRRPGHRSDRATLRRLAGGSIALRLPGDRDDRAFDESCLGTLALGVTALLGRHPAPNRRAAVRRIATEAARRLGTGSRAAWSGAERDGFRRLAPLVALLDDVEQWPRTERAALVRTMRKKGARRERDYARALASHDRFRRALAAWCASSAAQQR